MDKGIEDCIMCNTSYMSSSQNGISIRLYGACVKCKWMPGGIGGTREELEAISMRLMFPNQFRDETADTSEEMPTD